MQPWQIIRKEKEDHDNDNPALSRVIEKNIRTIIHLRSKAARERSLQGRIADLDLHIGLLTEHELTRVLQMLDTIKDKMGIVDLKNKELADLEMETRPEVVLAEIHRLQAIEFEK